MKKREEAEKEFQIRFGKNVQKIRLIRSLSLSQLALKCGLTTGYLSEIEHGKHNIGGDKIERILKELGVITVTFLDKDWEWDGSIE